MARWQRIHTHELDHLSTEQYHEIATGHDAAGWESQRQAFTELRDLAQLLSQRGGTALEQLRCGWSGEGAEAFAAEFGKLIDLFTGLSESAATNAEGMRELANVVESVRGEAELLDEEDRSWRANRDGEDARTVAAMREGVRGELRDRIKAADESIQHLAHAYLLDPPEPVRLGGMETIAVEAGGASSRSGAARPSRVPVEPVAAVAPPDRAPDEIEPAGAPSLESRAAHHGPAVAAEPPPAPVVEPPPAAGGMVPLGGMGMGGHIAAGGGAVRGDGPRLAAGRPVEASRMRSRASRQELFNRSGSGRARDRVERRAVGAEDSPFAPDAAAVVPPVISGGVDDVGPHDSGPVLTGTVYRHFPEYGEAEPVAVIAQAYEDGSSAVIEVGADAGLAGPAAAVRDDAVRTDADGRRSLAPDGGVQRSREETRRVAESGLVGAASRRAATAEPSRAAESAASERREAEASRRRQDSLAELRRLRAERRKAREQMGG